MFLTLLLTLMLNQNPDLPAENEAPEEEDFSVFDTGKETAENTKNSRPASSMFYININLQKQFQQDSVFLPDSEINILDSWVYIVFLRYSDTIPFTKQFSFKFKLGFHTTNQNNLAVSNLIDFAGLADPVHQIDSGFNSNLSFSKLYTYEAHADLQFADAFFLQGGFLSLLQGNSFFKNPVSFFERYFPQRQFFQEYNAFSAPALSLDYYGNKYSGKLLYKPAISTYGLDPSDDRRQLAEYLGINLPAHVLMFKNTIHISPVLSDIFIFAESPTHYNASFHFGLGTETTWNIIKTLSLQGQILYSNGIKSYSPVLNTGYSGAASYDYYTLEENNGSSEEYKFDGLLNLKFSGVSGYEFSLTYYYNGHGLTDSQYTSLIDKLQYSREQISSGTLSATADHQQFIYSVPGTYDIFSLRQHYIFFSAVDVQSTDYFTWGLTPMLSVSDFSWLLSAFINVNIATNGVIFLQALWSIGKPESVFHESILMASITGGIEWKF